MVVFFLLLLVRSIHRRIAAFGPRARLWTRRHRAPINSATGVVLALRCLQGSRRRFRALLASLLLPRRFQAIHLQGGGNFALARRRRAVHEERHPAYAAHADHGEPKKAVRFNQRVLLADKRQFVDVAGNFQVREARIEKKVETVAHEDDTDAASDKEGLDKTRELGPLQAPRLLNLLLSEIQPLQIDVLLQRPHQLLIIVEESFLQEPADHQPHAHRLEERDE
mmetsp:Transcript_90221/g.254553  ORF Transcript_90221/g.254553 Transcript_90221/m.254553 type:complete len:224 (-) Transcript_90221:2106-2777(-)